MKTTLRLKNLDELKAMQANLKAEQVILQKEIVSQGKSALISLPMKSLLKPADPFKMLKVNGKINLPAKVFSYLLPQIINRTLFKRSGFLTKIIMALTAKKIGKRIGPKIVAWLQGIMERYYPKANRQQPKRLN
ncbi:hypothetical protein [Pedobacter frigoris]|uniref:Uncharacterized protein n=1 Tax=Pedobacter frigoris TaxID=2571272 RepID=A0A4U1CHL3_9SPHI|nr:hypothetical protein [Pedobacter frigoris]TKC06087.1 hypothetical protein FA047_12210 [Pedobacter frigoris]